MISALAASRAVNAAAKISPNAANKKNVKGPKLRRKRNAAPRSVKNVLAAKRKESVASPE